MNAKLAQFLGLNNLGLTPSPERSQLVQMLQAQSLRPKMSQSPIESLNIASKPLLAALLAKQEGQARENDNKRSQGLRQALLTQMGQGMNEASLATAGLLQPDDPLGAFAVQRALTPQISKPPETREVKGRDNQGNETIFTEQWNSQLGRYERISEADRFRKGPLTEVNVNTNQTANEEFLRGVGERASTRVQEARVTHQNDAQLDRMSLALERGARAGRGEEFLLDLRSAAETFLGIPMPDSAGEQEIMRSVSNQLALQLRNPDSGLGLPGSVSNKDLDFLVNAVPGLRSSEEGNRMMIDFAKRLNQMRRDIASEQARLISESGGLTMDLDEKLMNFANNYELLTPQERALLEAGRRNGGSRNEEEVISLEDYLRQGQ